MELLKAEDIKRLSKKTQIRISEMQNRLYEAENLLDDLTRSVEIAQYSRQYQLTEVFVQQANELLKDRLVIPTAENKELNVRIYEGEADKETVDALRDAMLKDGVKTGPVNVENVERAAKKIYSDIKDRA